MRRTVLQYLDDILESIGNIEEDTSGISFEEFSHDRRRRDAVIRNFQVIGEAMKNSRTISRSGIPIRTGKRLPGSATSSPMSISGSNIRSSGITLQTNCLT